MRWYLKAMRGYARFQGRSPRVEFLEVFGGLFLLILLAQGLDRAMLDDGTGSSALFVQSVPYELAGTDWATAMPSYVDQLLAVCERYAPGTADLVADAVPLAPPGIEAHFGITGGHIHHVDNTVSFTDRMPYATGLAGLYAGSAGCYPGGSVIGAAGHNSARRILADLGR